MKPYIKGIESGASISLGYMLTESAKQFMQSSPLLAGALFIIGGALIVVNILVGIEAGVEIAVLTKYKAMKKGE